MNHLHAAALSKFFPVARVLLTEPTNKRANPSIRFAWLEQIDGTAIASMLESPAGGLYLIADPRAEVLYVGMTERSIKARLDEHAQGRAKPSALVKHVRNYKKTHGGSRKHGAETLIAYAREAHSVTCPVLGCAVSAAKGQETALIRALSPKWNTKHKIEV